MTAHGLANLIGTVYLLAWACLYGYAFRHRRETFWAGFLDPFGGRPRRLK